MKTIILNTDNYLPVYYDRTLNFPKIYDEHYKLLLIENKKWDYALVFLFDYSTKLNDKKIEFSETLPNCRYSGAEIHATGTKRRIFLVFDNNCELESITESLIKPIVQQLDSNLYSTFEYITSEFGPAFSAENFSNIINRTKT